MSNQVLPITKLPVGQVPDLVLVCGDPDRAEKTAAFLQDATLVSRNREYHSYEGTFQGHRVMVCSHGVGAAGAAVAFEELIAAGAKKLIRIGTCGGIQPAVQDGDLVIATSAIANIGYVQEVAPPHFPAVADVELSMALRYAAAASDHAQTIHSGMVITRDAFYGGVETHLTPSYAMLAQANVTAVEMECAALFVVGSLRNVATAAILAVDGNVLQSKESMDGYKPHRQVVDDAVTAEIQIALAALIALA